MDPGGSMRVWEGPGGSGRVRKGLGGSKWIQEGRGGSRGLRGPRRVWEGPVGSGRVREGPDFQISRFLNQHENPDLGQNSKIKTFKIHDNLLANTNYNADILPDNR